MKDVFLRRSERGAYIIPMLLHDLRSHVVLKAVLLDISAKGLRCFSNDRRMMLIPEEVLYEKTFRMEFDFLDVNTADLEGQVVNIHPGKQPRHERKIGIMFTNISPIVARDINRIVVIDAANAPKRPRTKT